MIRSARKEKVLKCFCPNWEMEVRRHIEFPKQSSQIYFSIPQLTTSLGRCPAKQLSSAFPPTCAKMVVLFRRRADEASSAVAETRPSSFMALAHRSKATPSFAGGMTLWSVFRAWDGRSFWPSVLKSCDSGWLEAFTDELEFDSPVEEREKL